MDSAPKPRPKHSFNRLPIQRQFMIISILSLLMIGTFRSEERRVGKECL